MSKYVIMSDKHRSIYGDNFVEFWGKNFDGYVSNVHKAGIYTKEEAMSKHRPEGHHYAIPLSLIGEIPENSNDNFVTLIEKGKVNDLLVKNGEKAIFLNRWDEEEDENFDGEGEITDRGEIAYFEDNM